MRPEILEVVRRARGTLQRVIEASPVLVWTDLPDVIKDLLEVEARAESMELAA